MEKIEYIFKAKIYQLGINWCIDVPIEITQQLAAEKGRIHIKGQINGFDFVKTLMPVKNEPYRLFVNQVNERRKDGFMGNCNF